MTDSDQQDADRTPTAAVVDVAEAARRLGVTPDAIRARLHRGTLEGEKVDGQWRVRLPVSENVEFLRSEATGSQQSATGKPTGGAVDQQATDRPRQDAATGSLEPMAQLIGDLARRNEELSAAVGMWQARAMHLEEQVKQLTATAGEASAAPERVETGDQDAAGVVPDQDAQRGAESVWRRLARWFGGR